MMKAGIENDSREGNESAAQVSLLPLGEGLQARARLAFPSGEGAEERGG